jgi:hypothetical protein
MPAQLTFKRWPLLLSLLFSTVALSQQPLPAFDVRDIGSGRIVISWLNQYPYTAQITIQRSFDSLRGYKSILTVPDPSAVQNGFADTKASNDHMFYRLYIQLDKGQYFFTTPRQPLKQIAAAPETATQQRSSSQPTSTTTKIVEAFSAPIPLPDNQTESNEVPKAASQFPVKKVEPVVIKLDISKMGDSAKVPFTVSPQNDPDAYAPSLYVYAIPEGHVRIDVPNKKRIANYRIRFYEADKQFLFELKQLPAPSFLLDKTNFLHSGWFLFELYDEARLLERHKVFLEKDF